MAKNNKNVEAKETAKEEVNTESKTVILNLQGKDVEAGDVVYAEGLYRHLLVVKKEGNLVGRDIKGNFYKLSGKLNNVTTGVEYDKMMKKGGK